MPGFDFSQFEAESKENSFNFDDFLEKNKIFLGFILLGVILIGLGVLFYKKQTLGNLNKIEVLETATDVQNSQIIIEVSGAVEKPGVYKMDNNDRIENALIAAGGLSSNADRIWVEKYLNRAAKLVDGQKIFIRNVNEITASSDKQTNGSSANSGAVYQTDTLSYSDDAEEKTNINEASLEKLDKLPGIGPVYGQKIIEQRPYSNSEELLSKKVIPKSTYEKIKDLITVY